MRGGFLGPLERQPGKTGRELLSLLHGVDFDLAAWFCMGLGSKRLAKGRLNSHAVVTTGVNSTPPSLLLRPLPAYRPPATQTAWTLNSMSPA